ncbi:PaaI family thioesterase [Ralstonia pickettii]|uniref:PaaI family thioesterase n=1 Tax=Ralstonia pickettii TaxID=329 RepID=UPI002714AC09|nr:PaaI family thioesterase [Ralstonia pickettii]WKZ86832.1 PaaI family thioesterase [Ralstonia pickettii]
MPADNNGFPIDIPFLKLLGMRCLKVADGEGVVELALEAQHMNSWEMAHGGVTMTMLDVAMAMAGRSADVHGRGVVTIEMKTAFMQPGRGTLKASAHCVHQSTTMAFCEGEVRDADDKLVARGSGTFKFVKRMPPPRTPEPGADG